MPHLLKFLVQYQIIVVNQHESSIEMSKMSMYRVTTLCVSFVTSLSCPVMSPADPSQAVHIPDSNHTCILPGDSFLSDCPLDNVQQNMFLTTTTTICQCSSPFSLWPPPPYQVASTDAMLRLSRKPVSHLNRYSSKGHFCIRFVKALILFQLLCGTSLDIAKLVPPTWSSPWARIEPSVLGGHHLGVIIKSAIITIIIIINKSLFVLLPERSSQRRAGGRQPGQTVMYYLCTGVMTRNLFQIIETV